MKLITVLIVGIITMSFAHDVPFVIKLPPNKNFHSLKIQDKKITPEKYDAKKDAKFKGESTLNYTIKTKDCIIIHLQDLKDVNLIDRLMSSNTIEYKVYKPLNVQSTNLYIFVRKADYQKAQSLIKSATDAKLMKKWVPSYK